MKKKNCCTPGCKNQTAKSRFCYTCSSRSYAKKNPLRYCYNALKQNAKRRGKVFELTFEQFTEFAIETDYINKRGRSSSSFTIDRIDPTKGYTVDNIQVMSNSGNVKKKAFIDSYYNPYQKKMEFYTRTCIQETPNYADVPF